MQIQTVLTDLQPMVQAWKELQETHGTSTGAGSNSITFINSSVDATKASRIVQSQIAGDQSATTRTDNKIEVRMIHLALHHFKPPLVKAMLLDAVESNAVIVVGDNVPTLPNIFLQAQWGVHEFIRLVPQILYKNPVKIVLSVLAPVWAFMSYWDAAISVMRAYSFEQLQELLEESIQESLDAQKKYKIETFQLYTFSDSLGMARGKIPLFDSYHIQYFVAVPEQLPMAKTGKTAP